MDWRTNSNSLAIASASLPPTVKSHSARSRIVLSGRHVTVVSVGHLAELVAGNVEWTHLWKGFGALAAAYVFAALALRGGRQGCLCLIGPVWAAA